MQNSKLLKDLMMSFFTIMNKMLDQNWKMTDYSCKECRTNALINEAKTAFFCCKCNKEIEFEESDGEHQE